MENCQLRRAVLAEADVAGLSPHRTGFQEVDFFRTPLKGVDFSDCIDIKDGKFTYSLDGKQMLETAIENIQRYVVSGYDENTGELIVKFVNATKEPFSTSVNLQNVTSVKRKGKVVTLTSADPKDENTLDDPKRVFPRESTFNKFSGQFDYTFEPWSFTVLRIKAEI